MTESFRMENEMVWTKIYQEIFGDIIPKDAVWKEPGDIISLLKIIGGYQSSNNVFLPGWGGVDLTGATVSSLKGCMELQTPGGPILVLPRSLTFERCSHDKHLDYFLLEIDDQKPLEFFQDNTEFTDGEFYEKIIELDPGKYIERSYWGSKEYEGTEFPAGSRIVHSYYRKGLFAIFQKSSPYNTILNKKHDGYEGIHNKLGPEGFKKYIENFNAAKYSTL